MLWRIWGIHFCLVVSDGFGSASAGNLTLAEPYGLVRQSLIKRNRALTYLQLNLKGFQVLNISI